MMINDNDDEIIHHSCHILRRVLGLFSMFFGVFGCSQPNTVGDQDDGIQV